MKAVKGGEPIHEELVVYSSISGELPKMVLDKKGETFITMGQAQRVIKQLTDRITELENSNEICKG